MTITKLIPIAALLLMITAIPVIASDEEENNSPWESIMGNLAILMWEYRGTVVHVDGNGNRHPIAGARFYSGEFESGQPVGKLTKDGKTDKSGRFSQLATCMIPLESVCEDSAEWVEWIVLKAKGCEDLVLEVTADWKPHEIEMVCPDL